MRYVSALAALTVIVLGTPAIALASTITAGVGPPAQTRILCPPPPANHVRPRPITVRHHGPAITRATGFMVLTPRPVR